MALPTRVDKWLSRSLTTNPIFAQGCSNNNVVVTSTGVVYFFYLNISSIPVFVKSTDYGFSISSETSIKGGGARSICCWFDNWSGITLTNLIYVAWLDNLSNNVLFRTIDTGNGDALGTVYTIFDGASSTAGGTLSITRTIGGNLICGGCIDAGTESFFKKSVDGGINWANITTAYEANTDQLLLFPGFAVDTNDAICIYWDASADEISRKLYDDSADSWSESSIATSMVDYTHQTWYPMFHGSVDLINSTVVLVAWSAADTLNADLRCFTISEAAITEKTNVVLNSTDDQGLVGISIDSSGTWWVFYCGASDGSEQFNTLTFIYYKKSTDTGTTWGSETRISAGISLAYWLSAPLLIKNVPYLIWQTGSSSYSYSINVPYISPRSTFQLGI